MSLSQIDSPMPSVTRSAHTPPGSLFKCPECGYAIPGESLAPILPSSRFEELSSCNDPPVDSERTALKAVVREGQANLASLRQRIAAVRKTLEILFKEQNGTVKRITDAKILLSPTRRLPADVLIEIFTTCLSDFTDSLDAKRAPWVLLQVCASWRQIALASTGLWANIQLRMDLYMNHMESLFRLKTVLNRAGEHRLRVFICGHKDFSDHPVFEMILSTSARWESLDVSAPLRSFRLFNSISHHLPLLETLWIKVSSFHRSDLRPESTDIIYGFPQAPRLRDLSVSQNLVSTMPFFTRLFNLPLETTPKLDLETTTSDVVSFLRSDAAQHLVRLGITLVYSKRRGLPQQIEIPVIRLGCLQVLCLTDSAAGLLSRLRLPALQYLMLLFHERAILPPISEETTPALTELALLSLLSDDVVDGRALADILKWTPNLTSMTFLGKVILTTNTLFIALGRSREGVFELVPHLKMISLQGVRFEFLDHGRVIADMVEARRAMPSGEGQAALKEVRLKDDLGVSERWEKLRQGGLIVHYDT